jgi:hypothetical protein
VEDFRALLRGRIGFGRDLQLVGRKPSVTFSPTDQFSWKSGVEKEVMIGFPKKASESMATSPNPIRGDYRIQQLPDLVIRVIPTEIKDGTGTKVVEVIG